jgi:hypothetical protein
MKKQELIRLKESLEHEINRRNRINSLLKNDIIMEFITLNGLDINEFDVSNNWVILEELLKDFKITRSNGILVCTGDYITDCSINYQETNYYEERVDFGSNYTQYRMFKDIETKMKHLGYIDNFVQRELEYDTYWSSRKISLSDYCHMKYNYYLISELKDKYILLNPYSSIYDENGFDDVRKDFFTEALNKGQVIAKKMLLKKYPRI